MDTILSLYPLSILPYVNDINTIDNMKLLDKHTNDIYDNNKKEMYIDFGKHENLPIIEMVHMFKYIKKYDINKVKFETIFDGDINDKFKELGLYLMENKDIFERVKDLNVKQLMIKSNQNDLSISMNNKVISEEEITQYLDPSTNVMDHLNGTIETLTAIGDIFSNVKIIMDGKIKVYLTTRRFMGNLPHMETNNVEIIFISPPKLPKFSFSNLPPDIQHYIRPIDDDYFPRPIQIPNIDNELVDIRNIDNNNNELVNIRNIDNNNDLFSIRGIENYNDLVTFNSASLYANLM